MGARAGWRGGTGARGGSYRGARDRAIGLGLPRQGRWPERGAVRRRHFHAWLGLAAACQRCGWGRRRHGRRSSDPLQVRSGRFGPELRLTQHGSRCSAQDLQFDQQVVGSAQQDQMLYVISPYDHELSLAVKAKSVDYA